MAKEFQKCELLVVGAGPAGSRAAARAARAGVATLLIDAKHRVGEPSHCGEFVPKKVFTECDIPTNSVIQSVSGMETRILVQDNRYVQHGSSERRRGESRNKYLCPVSVSEIQATFTPSPGFLIDRVRFDRELACHAAQKGACVLTGARLCSRERDGGWIFSCGNQLHRVTPKYVIAADGAASTVARLLKLDRPSYVVGCQLQVPLARPMDNTLVFLDRRFRGGYGWLFPKGVAANVGIGIAMTAGMSPQTLLHEFAECLICSGIVKHGILGTTKGLIPVSGPRKRLVVENVLFCGDAAGLTHPITGAGVGQAVLSGTLAGEHAAAAVNTGDPRHILDYERELREHFGNVMGHALAKRHTMMQEWAVAHFQSLCEQFWVAFKGYKRRSYDSIVLKHQHPRESP